MWKITNGIVTIITDPFTDIDYSMPTTETAKRITDKLSPIIAFPMHYKTSVLDFPIKPVEEYLELVDNHHHINSNQIDLSEDDFKAQQTITLNYA